MKKHELPISNKSVMSGEVGGIQKNFVGALQTMGFLQLAPCFPALPSTQSKHHLS